MFNRIFQLVNTAWSEIGDIRGWMDGVKAGTAFSLSGDGSKVAILMPGADENGTDSMLSRANKILKKSSNKKRQGILLKYPKTNQDSRIDLPTVGIKTLRLCVKIGLKGIALKSKYNIFINKKKMINYANSKKLFITVK